MAKCIDSLHLPARREILSLTSVSARARLYQPHLLARDPASCRVITATWHGRWRGRTGKGTRLATTRRSSQVRDGCGDSEASSDEGASTSGGQTAGNYGNRFAAVRRSYDESASVESSRTVGMDAVAEGAVAEQLAGMAKSMGGVGTPQLIVGASTAFYGAMTLAAVGLGEANGHMKIFMQLLPPWNVPAALPGLFLLQAGLVLAVKQSEAVPALSRMRSDYQMLLVPVLERVPAWGQCLMALGAGVGEEALFRAFMQESLVPMLGDSFLPPVAASIAVTSLAFGALHAVTPVSFYWALVASVLLGVEYSEFGLGTAVVTHWLYDWFAFYYICNQWGSGKPPSEQEQPVE